MRRKHPLYKFRDWLFDLLVDYLVNSVWIVMIKDFRKSEKRNERNYFGLVEDKGKVIYIDKHRGTPRILVHELCHFGLGIVLAKMSESLPWKELKKVKGKRRADKEFEWRELRTLEFEEFFYGSLTKRQIKTLQGFIDKARARGTTETQKERNTRNKN